MMKKTYGLFTILIMACVILTVLPVSAGVPFCWFNKWINTDCNWVKAPTTVYTTVGADVHWQMAISIAPPASIPGPITDVVVSDRFGAEWEIIEITIVSQGTVTTWTKGESEKVFLRWDVGTLNPGEMAYIIFQISTDLNPSGKQEYTSPGCYQLNSGAVLKFRYEGRQYSAYTLPIHVSVAEV